jgi:hypothetical protein
VPVLLISTGLIRVTELLSLMRISPAMLMLGGVCGPTGPLGVLITLLVPATVSISPPESMETVPYWMVALSSLSSPPSATLTLPVLVSASVALLTVVASSVSVASLSTLRIPDC